MRFGIRTEILLVMAAVAAAASAVLLALALPLLARGRLTAAALCAVVVAATAVVVALGATVLFRAVVRPVDRLLAAAARIEPPEGVHLPLLGDQGGASLGRAAVAFERTAAALLEERARLASKVAELTEANVALAETRESLVRSERLATVGLLASGVAHEVGNPLGAIAGYVELARARLPPGSPELADYVGRIAAETERIDRIVRDLLDFSRPAQPALAAIDLAPAVEGALRIARLQTRFRAVEVDLALPPGLPRVWADEHHLAQVLVNLFLNAGDAMQGGGALGVSAAEADPGAVELRVADRGPGIPARDLTRVFDPFFTTKAPGQGTGLGLAICHRIMESFGGEISAANREGGGACFTLRFRAGSAQERPMLH